MYLPFPQSSCIIIKSRCLYSYIEHLRNSWRVRVHYEFRTIVTLMPCYERLVQARMSSCVCVVESCCDHSLNWRCQCGQPWTEVGGGQNPALLTVKKTLMSANVGRCTSSPLQHWRIRSSSSLGRSAGVTTAPAGDGGSPGRWSACHCRSTPTRWSSLNQSYGLHAAAVIISNRVTPNDHTSLFVEYLPWVHRQHKLKSVKGRRHTDTMNN